MADLPQPWRAYARLQIELSDNGKLDARYWGAEAGLNHFLVADPDSAPRPDAEIARARSAGARRERSRSRWRAVHLEPFVQTAVDPEPGLAARRELRSLCSLTTPDEWALLCGLAIGHEYADLAQSRGSNPGASRLAALRLRNRLKATTPSSASPGRVPTLALAS